MLIDEKTRVGLYSIVAIVPTFAISVFFIATIYYKAEASEGRLDRQAEAIKDQRVILIELKERTARMEAMLALLTKNKE